jgi:hypothetical protein
MAKLVSVIIRGEKEGWWAWTPQCPELITGRNTEAKLLRSLPKTLAWCFEEDGDIDDIDIRIHVERKVGDGVVVRVARDERQDARQAVADRFVAALADPDLAGRLRAAPQNPVGEVVYICALPTDTRVWLEDQMEDRRGAVNVVVPVSGTMLWTWPVGDQPGDAAPNTGDAAPPATFGDVARASDRQRILVPA